jgi:hypothetical protein
MKSAENTRVRDYSTLAAPTVTEPLKERWAQFLRDGKPGAVFCYCVAVNLGSKSVTAEERDVADLARVAFSDGLVELCQDKVGSEYEYLAQETGKANSHGQWDKVASEDS